MLDDGTYTYEYDDEGNRVKRTETATGAATEYDWDHRNRLTQVTNKDAAGNTLEVVAYTYDLFNRRISRAYDTTSPFDLADAAIERYILDDLNGVTSLDGGNVILDFVDPDGDGPTSITLDNRQLYSNAIDQVLAQENVAESLSSPYRTMWHLRDHIGTVRDLAKNDSSLATHYVYDSFGRPESGDVSLTRYLFTGREHDAATDIQYNRARWYASDTGRWLTRDPIGFSAGDANPLRYVSNNALAFTDPLGLAEVNILILQGPDFDHQAQTLKSYLKSKSPNANIVIADPSQTQSIQMTQTYVASFAQQHGPIGGLYIIDHSSPSEVTTDLFGNNALPSGGFSQQTLNGHTLTASFFNTINHYLAQQTVLYLSGCKVGANTKYCNSIASQGPNKTAVLANPTHCNGAQCDPNTGFSEPVFAVFGQWTWLYTPSNAPLALYYDINGSPPDNSLLPAQYKSNPPKAWADAWIAKQEEYEQEVEQRGADGVE